MLVATLSLLIGMLLGGGNISAYVVEDFPKEVKRNVDEKERQKDILAITKPYEKEFKSVQKDLKKSKKQMKKLHLDRNASSEDINEILDNSNTSWKDIQAKGVAARTEVMAMLSDEEWELIIANSMEEFDKKEIKKQKKAYDNFEKKFTKLRATVSKEITDPEHLEKIFATFDSFQADMKSYVEANMNRTAKELEEFSQREATEDELNAAFSVVDEARDRFFEGIEKLHFDLVELTTEEEYAKIAKAVNKTF